MTDISNASDLFLNKAAQIFFEGSPNVQFYRGRRDVRNDSERGFPNNQALGRRVESASL
ncbi:hypothetical protein TURTL08_01120 [Turicimonas sp. TL08]